MTSYAKSAANTKLLKNIFSFAYHLYSKGLIGEYGSVDRMTGVRALNKEFNMQFLFPSEKYYQLYNRVAYSQWEGNNNPNANLLCTVIRIYSSEVSYILTSDAVQKVFKELYQKCPIRDQLIKAAQVSHHGAGGNFDRGFWKSVRNANKSQYAIVSVGQNDYGHPEEEAMNELSKSGYEVKYTNPPEFWKATSHHPLSLIGTRVSKGRDDFEGKDIIVN